MTGTNILALARVWAQDNDVNSNFGVGAADALVLLNALLADWGTHFGVKNLYINGTTSGLSFSAGDVTKETDGSPTFLEIISAHPSKPGALSFPLAPPLERVTTEEIQAMLGYDGDVSLSPQAAEWTHFAAERSQDLGDESTSTEKWRIWAYPVINRARYMTLNVVPFYQITAITNIPDVDEGDARVIARLLAWEIARLKKETSQVFLDSILSPLPKEVLQKMYRGGVTMAQLQSSVLWRDW
jgi:hypothetical protein